MFITTTFSGQNYVEDVARRSINLQVIDEHWRGKGACLDHTTVPGYVMASYTNPIHIHSSFAGFRSVPFPRQVTFQGRTNYAPEHVEDLKKFFVCYLEEIDGD